MSSSGLVHCNPGQPTSFISLPDWARESAQFNAVTSLPFFRLAMPRKAFSAWRANVRFARYRAQHAALARALFPWKPAFAGAMREITGTLSRIASLPVLDLTAPRYTVGSFHEAQASSRSDALRLIEREINTIHAAVERVCGDVAARAHATGDGDGDPYGDHVLVKSREAKTKSMAAARAEAEANAAALLAAAEEEAKLGPFVRLVDYLLVQTLSGLLVSQLQRLHSELAEPDARRSSNGMFATTLLFDAGQGECMQDQPMQRPLRAFSRSLV